MVIVKKILDFASGLIKRNQSLALAIGFMLAAFGLQADTNTVQSVTEIVNNASTVWTAVSGLILTVAAFTILVRYVRKLK